MIEFSVWVEEGGNLEAMGISLRVEREQMKKIQPISLALSDE